MITTPKIKICGVCSITDAAKAVEAGADYIGMMFVPESEGYVSASEASKIADVTRGNCKLVGVCQDAECSFINETTRRLGLDLVQLHGNESPDFCSSVPAPTIKAITIGPKSTPATEEDVSLCKKYVEHEISLLTN